jgi:hypothetical protein
LQLNQEKGNLKILKKVYSSTIASGPVVGTSNAAGQKF